MSFNEKLPEWNNTGVEPPQSKKDEGFSPGEKPPAQWFNWLLNRIYKAIQELREKVVVKVAGKDLSSNDYTTEEKIKLGGISKQATKVESSVINGNIKIDGVNIKVYEHPASHQAAMIEESTAKRFVSDTEKNNWNGKETPTGAQEKANAALTAANSYTDQEIGDKTIDDTLVATTDTGLSVKILLSWLANMIKSITGKASWRIKPTKNLEELNTTINEHKADSMSYSTYKLNPDDNGIFTEIQYKRSNGTLIMKSILSGGTSPNYTTRTETEYEQDGITVKTTKVYTITYIDDKVTSEVLQ